MSSGFACFAVLWLLTVHGQREVQRALRVPAVAQPLPPISETSKQEFKSLKTDERFFFENSPKCLTPSLDRAVQAVPGEHVLWEEKGIIPALGRALF